MIQTVQRKGISVQRKVLIKWRHALAARANSPAASTERVFGIQEHIISSNIRIFRLNISICKQNIHIFRTNILIFRPNILIFRQNISIFRTNILTFRLNIRIFRLNISICRQNIRILITNIRICMQNIRIIRTNIHICMQNMRIFRLNIRICMQNIRIFITYISIANARRLNTCWSAEITGALDSQSTESCSQSSGLYCAARLLIGGNYRYAGLSVCGKLLNLRPCTVPLDCCSTEITGTLDSQSAESTDQRTRWS